MAAAGSGELPRPATVGPVQRLQFVQDQQDPNVLLLHDAVSHKQIKNQFVIDPMVKVQGQSMRASEALKKYATQAQKNMEDGKKQTPVLISGPVKSGKSHTAEVLLPAVVHSTFDFDYSSSAGSRGSVVDGTAQKPPAPIFLHVNCASIRRTVGVTGFFLGLLTKLKLAAKAQGLAAALTPVPPGDASSEDAEAALMDFYESLPRDRITYVTFDEAQSFFLLEAAAAEQQKQLWVEVEIRQMRRSFKSLVTTAPAHVATVVTGSTMAMVWANFAMTPTNGLALLDHNFTLHLPGYSDAEVMRSTWQCLQQQYGQLPAALRSQSMPGHALLIWLVEGWVQGGRGEVSDMYVLRRYQSKLYPEVLADLRVVAETLAASDPEGTRSFAKHLLNLLDCNVGCSEAGLQRTGMLAFLGNELQAAAVPRHVWVHSPVYKDMLQLVLSKDGELQLNGFPEEPAAGDYAKLMTLQSLGEEYVSVRKSLHSARNKPLLDLLQQLATDLQLDTQRLYHSQWYQRMLQQPASNHKDPRNPNAKSAREVIDAGMKAGRMNEIDLLLGYSTCIRHVISHSCGYQWWLLMEGGCVPQLLHLVRTGQVDASLAALRAGSDSQQQ